jgi:hypothetical protein
MEGYLFKRSSGGLLGKAWRKRWCIFEESKLKMYDNFDNESSKAKGLHKNVIDLDSSWLVRRVDTDREFTFILTHDDHPSWYLAANTKNELDFWMKELTRVILSSNPLSFDFTGKEGYYQTLGMSKDMLFGKTSFNEEELKIYFHRSKQSITNTNTNTNTNTDSNVNNNGNTDDPSIIEKLYLLRVAFYAVHQKHFSNKYLHDFRHKKYECNVLKNEDGNMGFTLAESPTNSGWIVVSSIDDKILNDNNNNNNNNNNSISDMTSEGKGKIRIHDGIFSIEKDIVTGWPLSRVLQRLNSYRVKPNSKCHITFGRPHREDDEVRHENENLHEEFIICAQVTDQITEKQASTSISTSTSTKNGDENNNSSVSKKNRGSIFGWKTEADTNTNDNDNDDKTKAESTVEASSASTSGDSDGDHDVDNDNESVATASTINSLPAKPVPERKSMLQRARASLSWANSSALTEQINQLTTDDNKNTNTNTNTKEIEIEIEIKQTEYETMKIRAETAEKKLKLTQKECDDLKSKINEYEKNEMDFNIEIKDLTAQLHAANAPNSQRSYALNQLGMHEKMAKLRERYPISLTPAQTQE